MPVARVHSAVSNPEAQSRATSAEKIPARPWRAMHLTWACLPMTPVCDLGLVLIFGFSHCGLRRSYCSVSVTPENFVICCQEWDQMLQVLRAFFVRLLEGPLSVNDEVQNAATPADDTFKKEP